MRNFFNKIVKNNFFPTIVLIVIIFGLYGQTLFFDFSTFDDYDLIVRKHYFLSDPQNIPKAFQQEAFMSSHGVIYRPILTLTFMIDSFIGKLNPFQYHLSNVLFHAVAVLLLFFTLILMKLARPAAFISSMIMAVHPVLTQAVAWIPGRNDSLLCIFITASFYFFLKLKTSEEFSFYKRMVLYFFHFLFFFLSLLTKETALIFPVMLIVYVLVVNQSNPTRLPLQFQFGGQVKKSNILIYFVWGMLLLIWYALRMNAISSESEYVTGLHRNIFDNSIGFLSYIGKVFFPFGLSVIPLPESINLIYIVSGVVLVSAILLIKGVRDIKKVVFGLLWFVIFLFPTFINITGFSNYMEHRVYVPSLGIVFALNESKLLLDLRMTFKVVIFSALIVIFSVITYQHSKVFSDGDALWNSAVKDSPNNFFTRKGLGNVYHRVGMFEKAEAEYLRAIELEPKSAETLNNLGLNYKKMGLLDKSKDCFRRALKLNPVYAEAHNNLGIVYFDLNKQEDAKSEYFEAIKIKHDYFEAHNNLGTWYAKNNQLPLAKYQFEKALHINPYFAEAHYNLVIFYYSQRDYEMAIYHLDKAIQNGFNVNKSFLELLDPYRK